MENVSHNTSWSVTSELDNAPVADVHAANAL